MPQYLVANYLPDDFDPSTVTEAIIVEQSSRTVLPGFYHKEKNNEVRLSGVLR